jgi:hypothetical protein
MPNNVWNSIIIRLGRAKQVALIFTFSMKRTSQNQYPYGARRFRQMTGTAGKLFRHQLEAESPRCLTDLFSRRIKTVCDKTEYGNHFFYFQVYLVLVKRRRLLYHVY